MKRCVVLYWIRYIIVEEIDIWTDLEYKNFLIRFLHADKVFGNIGNKMKRQQVLNCNFSAWYPKFKNVTIRSRVIPLPKEFIDYLKADNVYLPGEPICTTNTSSLEEETYCDTHESVASEEDAYEQPNRASEFNDVETRIKEALFELEGSIFPKLNWTCPLDASWISCDGTLKCTCPNDVYLLLKSSDDITRVVFDTFKHCEDGEGQLDDGFELILRKWKDINPAMEFRCFVKNNELIAISQRDVASCYDFIEQCERAICSDINSFYNNKIANKFPDSSYTFDVYRCSAQNVLLIDFNPFGFQTDPLLFSWNELNDSTLNGGDDVYHDEFQGVFKYLTNTAGMQPSPRYTSKIPTDIVDLVHGTDINKLVDLLSVENLIRNPGEESDSD